MQDGPINVCNEDGTRIEGQKSGQLSLLLAIIYTKRWTIQATSRKAFLTAISATSTYPETWSSSAVLFAASDTESAGKVGSVHRRHSETSVCHLCHFSKVFTFFQDQLEEDFWCPLLGTLRVILPCISTQIAGTFLAMVEKSFSSSKVGNQLTSSANRQSAKQAQ